MLLLATSETTTIRLSELIRATASDWRIQAVFTIPSPRARNSIDLEHLIQNLRLPYVPWELAISEPFDLALAESVLEERPELDIPLVMISHGPGHTKTISLPQKSKNHRNWLADRSNPNARRIIGTANEEEACFFGKSCETFVLGDPVFDSLLYSLHRKEEFKRAFGAKDKKFVVISSTWHDDSLIGSLPKIAEALLARYPQDEYAFALILHHAIWNTHHDWQIKTWLREPLRSGLILVDPERSWQAAIVAADLFVGDYGSVSLYSNLLDAPCCFVNLPEDGLNREYAIVAATDQASHAKTVADIEAFLDNPPEKPLEKIERARSESFANLGCAAQVLSEKIYELLGLDRHESSCAPINLASPDFYREEPRSWFIMLENICSGGFAVKRYPAYTPTPKGGGILIARSDEADYRMLASCSGVILCAPGARNWWMEVAPFAQCALVHEDGRFEAIDRNGNAFRLSEQTDAPPECILGAIILSRRLGQSVEISQGAGAPFCVSAQPR